MPKTNQRNSKRTVTKDPEVAEKLAAIKAAATEIKGAEKVAAGDKPIPNTDDQATLDLLGEVAGRFAERTYPSAYYVIKEALFKTKESILTDDEGIALLDMSRMGYQRWSSGKVVERANWVPILKHREPLRPDSFNDEARWDTWENGGKKDPWQFTLEVPIVLKSGRIAGRVVMFTANTRTSSEAAVGDLFLIARAEKQGWRPRIKFAVIEGQPVLQVVEFTDDASDIPGLAPATGNAGPKPAPHANGSANRQAGGGRAIDDEIPFTAEFR